MDGFQESINTNTSMELLNDVTIKKNILYII